MFGVKNIVKTSRTNGARNGEVYLWENIDMNKVAFLETMINTLKFDSKFKDKKEKLLPILRRCEINPIPQWAYVQHSGRSGQRYENVEIRVPVPLLDEANSEFDDLYELVEYVYEDTEEYGLGGVPIRPLIRTVENMQIEHDVVFSEIQETVIQGIRDAKYLIWAAIAWFSSEPIFQELRRKKEAGIDIRIIISDEESNYKLLARLKENFDVVVIPRYGWKNYNRMHDKFCIIDLEYVMHGSYNWTPTADYNEETLATALDKEFVKKFADEFMRMWISLK